MLRYAGPTAIGHRGVAGRLAGGASHLAGGGGFGHSTRGAHAMTVVVAEEGAGRNTSEVDESGYVEDDRESACDSARPPRSGAFAK